MLPMRRGRSQSPRHARHGPVASRVRHARHRPAADQPGEADPAQSSSFGLRDHRGSSRPTPGPDPDARRRQRADMDHLALHYIEGIPYAATGVSVNQHTPPDIDLTPESIRLTTFFRPHELDA